MELQLVQSRINLSSKMYHGTIMCETLDEIHEAQLAAIIARMRKDAKRQEEKPIPAIA